MHPLATVRASIPAFEYGFDGSPYTVYVVQLTCHGVQWTVRRRYREFAALHKKLCHTFPEVRTVSFPARTLFASSALQEDTIAKRKILLCTYVTELLSMASLRHEPQFVAFLQLFRGLAGCVAPVDLLYEWDIGAARVGGEERDVVTWRNGASTVHWSAQDLREETLAFSCALQTFFSGVPRSAPAVADGVGGPVVCVVGEAFASREMACVYWSAWSLGVPVALAPDATDARRVLTAAASALVFVQHAAHAPALREATGDLPYAARVVWIAFDDESTDGVLSVAEFLRRGAHGVLSAVSGLETSLSDVGLLIADPSSAAPTASTPLTHLQLQRASALLVTVLTAHDSTEVAAEIVVACSGLDPLVHAVAATLVSPMARRRLHLVADAQITSLSGVLASLGKRPGRLSVIADSSMIHSMAREIGAAAASLGAPRRFAAVGALRSREMSRKDHSAAPATSWDEWGLRAIRRSVGIYNPLSLIVIGGDDCEDVVKLRDVGVDVSLLTRDDLLRCDDADV